MPSAPKHKGKRVVDKKFYDDVRERDGFCLWGLYHKGKRGGPCQGRLHVHHIQYRGRGGDDSVDNGVVLCARHHTYVHDNNVDPQELFDLVKRYSL